MAHSEIQATVERDIEQLNSFEKFDYFNDLSVFIIWIVVKMARTAVTANL